MLLSIDTLRCTKNYLNFMYLVIRKIILDISNDSRSTALSSECIASRSGEGYLNLKIAAITLVRLQDGH